MKKSIYILITAALLSVACSLNLNSLKHSQIERTPININIIAKTDQDNAGFAAIKLYRLFDLPTTSYKLVETLHTPFLKRDSSTDIFNWNDLKNKENYWQVHALLNDYIVFETKYFPVFRDPTKSYNGKAEFAGPVDQNIRSLYDRDKGITYKNKIAPIPVGLKSEDNNFLIKNYDNIDNYSHPYVRNQYFGYGKEANGMYYSYVSAEQFFSCGPDDNPFADPSLFLTINNWKADDINEFTDIEVNHAFRW